ncbi:hypothetical protein AHAS_Ahas01G0102700 [Arachis hypogaea]
MDHCLNYLELDNNKNAPTVLHLVTTKEPALENNAAPQAKKSAGTTRTPNAARMQRKQQQKQQQNFSQRGRAIHKL